jgi:hypothetical protein
VPSRVTDLKQKRDLVAKTQGLEERRKMQLRSRDNVKASKEDAREKIKIHKAENFAQ